VATVTRELHPEEAVFGTAASPAYDKTNGTNFAVTSLKFDAATEETCYFKFRATSYGSGNLTLTVCWYADTATSGDVIWGAAVACITPDTDSQDVETKAFGTAATATDTHLGTTAQRVQQIAVTISSLDSLAANDVVWLKVYRDADAAGDTLTGDAQLTLAVLTYSDT
jgi:hypothetical protein